MYNEVPDPQSDQGSTIFPIDRSISRFPPIHAAIETRNVGLVLIPIALERQSISAQPLHKVDTSVLPVGTVEWQCCNSLF